MLGSKNSDEALYHFLWDQGRHGKLEGWFLARPLDVEDVIGEDMYFGDVFGKHSDVSGALKREHVIVLSRAPGDIEAFQRVVCLTDKSWLGWNPLVQITLHCESCDKDVEFANRHLGLTSCDGARYCKECMDKMIETKPSA